MFTACIYPSLMQDTVTFLIPWSTVLLVKLIVAHSRNPFPCLWNPKFQFFFKSEHMTADYSRKINVVNSGNFATGFKKISNSRNLRQSRPRNVLPNVWSKPFRNIFSRWVVCSLSVGNSYFSLCVCDISSNRRRHVISFSILFAMLLMKQYSLQDESSVTFTKVSLYPVLAPRCCCVTERAKQIWATLFLYWCRASSLATRHENIKGRHGIPLGQ